MKSDFERKRFIRRFWLAARGVLILTVVCLLFVPNVNWVYACVVLGVEAIGCLLLFWLCEREVDRVYREMEHISGEMRRVVENTEELPEEEYR